MYLAGISHGYFVKAMPAVLRSIITSQQEEGRYGAIHFPYTREEARVEAQEWTQGHMDGLLKAMHTNMPTCIPCIM